MVNQSNLEIPSYRLYQPTFQFTFTMSCCANIIIWPAWTFLYFPFFQLSVHKQQQASPATNQQTPLRKCLTCSNLSTTFKLLMLPSFTTLFPSLCPLSMWPLVTPSRYIYILIFILFHLQFVLGTEKKGEEKPKQQSTMVSIVKNFSLLHNVFLVVLSISMFCGIIYAAIERYTV